MKYIIIIIIIIVSKRYSIHQTAHSELHHTVLRDLYISWYNHNLHFN